MNDVTTSTETIDTYLAAYGEPDPDRRRELIVAAFADGGVLADPPFVATGHDELHATFAAVQEQLGQLAEAGVQRVMLQWMALDDLDRLAALAEAVL